MNSWLFGILMFLSLVVFILVLSHIPVGVMAFMLIFSFLILAYVYMRGRKLGKDEIKVLVFIIAMVLVFHFLDLVSTYNFMSKGIGQEGNNLMVWLLDAFGGWAYVISFVLGCLMYSLVFVGAFKLNYLMGITVFFVYVIIKLAVVVWNFWSVGL